MADPAPDGNTTNTSFWKSLSKRLSDRRKDVTEEDIRELVEAGEEKGVIEGSQKDMIDNIFEFGDMTAEDIMTPRTEVEALDADDDTLQDALRIAVEEGFSRVPVFEEDIDHVIGVLYVKDLLQYVGKPLPEDVTLRKLMREAYFVPGTKNCQSLLAEMTEKHIQLAMVVDEYGGLAGIVSMEDLLESIVGSIQDEYDHEEDEVKQREDNSFEVDGAMAVDEVGELLGIAFPEEDYETLAGFLIDRLGCIPSADDHAQVVFENWEFTVLSMDERRVELVHIRRLETEEQEND